MSDWNLRSKVWDWLFLGTVALSSLITAIYPTLRAFYRFQVNYNEGWNVYNVAAIVHHVPLYYPKYSWTTVNYPPLSFYVVKYLSYLTHDYLLTGRMLSLFSFVLSCLVIGLIIARLTGKTSPALFGAFFCLALFCTESSDYVAMDDPQMFAQLFFLIGLLLYLSRPRTLPWIAATVFLFVLGGSIKHNLLDFPLAILLDLCFVSYRKALRFLLLSAAFLGASVAISTYIGGPFYVSKLLTPRAYSVVSAIRFFLIVYGPIQLPFWAALLWAIKSSVVQSERVISLFFFASLFVGVGFAGGAGAASNYFFSNFFAISIIVGMLFYSAWSTESVVNPSKLLKWGIPIALYSSLLYPFYLSGGGRPGRQFAEMTELQEHFEAEVSFLKTQPGLAICESLLRCYDAGKPYVYDPFNSTSLMKFNKLDSRGIVAKLEAQQYGAIQLKSSLESLNRPNNHFPDEILDAINRYYVPSLKDPDCYIYVPRLGPKGSGNTTLGTK